MIIVMVKPIMMINDSPVTVSKNRALYMNMFMLTQMKKIDIQGSD
jgi:hypothetical protein